MSQYQLNLKFRQMILTKAIELPFNSYVIKKNVYNQEQKCDCYFHFQILRYHYYTVNTALKIKIFHMMQDTEFPVHMPQTSQR